MRYGIPALLLIAGVVALLVAGDGAGPEAYALFTGAGLSVLLLNVLHRIGVSGDKDRGHEEAEREYFDEHGYWRDQAPRD